jgi:3-hydroxyacyl-[acyl-carrier-protein] dehydratase
VASSPAAAITDRIPHRPPFLFVDEIVADVEDNKDAPCLKSRWTVPVDAAFFAGHYPGNPILPGVILSEFVFQSGALMVGGLASDVSGAPVLVRIQDARYRRICRPGETLDCELTLTDQLGPAWHLKAKVSVAGDTALTLKCVLALVPEETPNGAPEAGASNGGEA